MQTIKEQREWLSQLVQTRINDKNLEEALELTVESTAQLYDIFNELNISKESCRKSFRPDFEDKLNQQNSLVLMDPSNNNQIVCVRIFRDLTKIDQTRPKEGNYPCAGYYQKALINHELMEGIYCKKDYKEKDYEVTVIYNVHPDYASRGVTLLMNQIYGKDAYIRGVKKLVNILYNPVMVRMLSRLKGANPTILKEISLEGREIDGKQVFQKTKTGYLQTLDINVGLLRNIGFRRKDIQQMFVQQQQQPSL